MNYKIIIVYNCFPLLYPFYLKMYHYFIFRFIFVHFGNAFLFSTYYDLKCTNLNLVKYLVELGYELGPSQCFSEWTAAKQLKIDRRRELFFPHYAGKNPKGPWEMKKVT